MAEPLTSRTVAEPQTSRTVAEPLTSRTVAELLTFCTVAEPLTFCTVAEPLTFCTVAESWTRTMRPARTSDTSACPPIIQQPSTISDLAPVMIIFSARALRVASACTATSSHHPGAVSSSSRHAHVAGVSQSSACGVSSTFAKC